MSYPIDDGAIRSTAVKYIINIPLNASGMTEKDAYIAFNLTDKIGPVKVAALISKYGSAVAAWENCPVKVSRAGGEVDFAGELATAKRFNVEILTPADAQYPQILRDTPGAPLAIYVKGSVEALGNRGIAIVGTRRSTPYGRDQAFAFARDLAANGWMIVSGLAIGIDAAAHEGALAAGGVTVGVIGSGLDRFYPEENRALAREIVEHGGAVVSEFPFGRAPDVQTFPQRNHVVAALARGIVAVESPIKSGTLITAGFAADLGRTVMAVPGRVDSRSSQGCLKLIRDGARLVRSPFDVEEEMGGLFPLRETVAAISPRACNCRAGKVATDASKAQTIAAPAPFSIEEAIVMKHIDREGVSIDELVRKTKFSAAKVNALCMALRLKGRVRYFPGNRVALPRD